MTCCSLQDVLKFGFSSREYVLLHDQSKEDEDEKKKDKKKDKDGKKAEGKEGGKDAKKDEKATDAATGGGGKKEKEKEAKKWRRPRQKNAFKSLREDDIIVEGSP